MPGQVNSPLCRPTCVVARSRGCVSPGVRWPALPDWDRRFASTRIPFETTNGCSRAASTLKSNRWRRVDQRPHHVGAGRLSAALLGRRRRARSNASRAGATAPGRPRGGRTPHRSAGECSRFKRSSVPPRSGSGSAPMPFEKVAGTMAAPSAACRRRLGGGRWWIRTTDILLVRQALSATELIAPFLFLPRGKHLTERGTGVEPATLTLGR